MLEDATPKQRAWFARWLENGFNNTEAARHVGYKNPEKSGWENSKKLQAEITETLEQMSMGRAEVLARIAAQARGDIGDYITIRRTKYRESLAVTREVGLRRVGMKIEEAKWRLEHTPLSPEEIDALEVDVARWQMLVDGWNADDASVVVHLQGEGAEVERAEEFIDVEGAKRDGKMYLIKRYKRTQDGLQLEPYDAQKALDMLAKAHGIYSDAKSGDDGDFSEWLESLPKERG